MFRNKIAITVLALILFFSGLFLLYTSNINKTLLVDIYAENPLLIQEDKQLNEIQITEYNDRAYTFSLPASFLYQTKTINFQNTSNENVQLAFYSEQKKDDSKEIEFSLNVKNIQVNGQKFHTKKETVWNERPYIDTVSVNEGETVSLSVKYKTKLMLRNMNVPQAAASIVLLLCSIALLMKCYWTVIKKYLIKFIRALEALFEECGEWDTLAVQKYLEIETVYKKTFWTVFIILNLAFLYYNIHFIWGNHDLHFFLYGMWGEVSWSNARFTNYLPNQLLGGRFLPLLTVSLALFGYSFAGILLANYWKVQKTFFNYLVISLIVVLNPLVLYWMYFAVDVISHLWLPSIMILALILSEKKSIYYFILAYLLFIFGYGIYASAIATVASVFLGKIIIVYSFENHSIKFLYQKFKRTCCCIVLSLISFKIIINILIALDFVNGNGYNVRMNILGGSFENFLEIIKNSYRNLTYAIPFYDYNIIWIIYGICIFSVIALCWYLKKFYIIKFPQFCFILTAICLFPLTFNLTEFISGEGNRLARILFFGYIFLGAFFAALILKTRFIWAKNILIVFLIFLLPMNVLRLVEYQKLWKMEFDHEKTIVGSVVETICGLPESQFAESFIIIFFGRYFPHFSSFYQGRIVSYDTSGINNDLINSSVFPSVIMSYVPNFNHKKSIRFIKDQQNLEATGSWLGETIDIKKAIDELLPYYDVIKNMQSQKFVQVQDNYIFINFNNKILQEVLNKLDDKRREQGEMH